MVAGLTTGLNVSSQSMPGCCDLPFATSRALYRASFLVESNLCLYNHMERIMLADLGRGTKDHVPVLIRALYSSPIAGFQLGSLAACTWLDGKGETVVVWRQRRLTGLTIHVWLRVCIRCVVVGAAVGRAGVMAGCGWTVDGGSGVGKGGGLKIGGMGITIFSGGCGVGIWAKGKTFSSNTTCLEKIIFLVDKSRHLKPRWSDG